MVGRRVLALCCGIATFVGATFGAPARAQTPAAQQVALPLTRFEPSWAGDRFFGTAAPYVPGHYQFHGRVDGEYVHNPFVLRLQDGEERDEVGSVVEHQLLMHLNGTFTVLERLAVNVNFPIALHQEGDDPQVGRVGFASPTGAEIGDLRLGLRAGLTGGPNDFFQLGIGAQLWVPTASDEAGSFLGNGHIRGKPHLMASGVALRFVWGVDIGAEFRETQTVLGVRQGTLLTLKLANGVLLGPRRELQLSVEINGALVPVDVSDRTLNIEALAGAKWRFLNHFVVGGGVGPGLSGGIGTPDVRALLTLGFSPAPTWGNQRSDPDDES